MRMPSQAHKTILLGVMMMAATSGCSSTYWATMANASRATASLVTPGLVAWTVTKNTQGAITSAKVVATAPSISLLLDANSSPVSFTNAQVDYYDVAAADAKGKAARNPLANAEGGKVGSLYFPFVAQLAIKDRATVPVPQSFTLNGVISQELVDLTNPSSTDSIAIPTVLADVTLRGTNALGQVITANVQVPINISVQ